MGHPVALALAALVGLATAYCLARCAVPRWRAGHGAAVDGWHVLMGAATVAMLLAPVGSASATVQAMVFGIGALWCACHLLARTRSGALARLGVACLVMVAMLVPAVVANPATAASPEHHHVPGMDMSAMPTDPNAHSMAMPPGWLAVVMLVGIAVVAVSVLHALLDSTDRRTSVRLSLACEAVMAAAMGYLVALAW